MNLSDIMVSWSKYRLTTYNAKWSRHKRDCVWGELLSTSQLTREKAAQQLIDAGLAQYSTETNKVSWRA